ncbi:hypothetical protein JZU69_05295, partial [bacterium]|nr:hypothetical protein [bacterium]
MSVRATNAVKTYDAIAYSGGNGVAYSGFVNSETSSVLGGTLSYSGTSQGALNVGSYVISPAGLNSSNYNLNFVDGALTISAAPITASTIAVSKTYDGTTVATLEPLNYLLTGWVGSDSASVTKTSGTFDNANAGSAKTVTVSLTNSDYAAAGSSNLSNYSLPTSATGAAGTINKANAMVTANSSKVTYNGNAQNVTGFTATGLVNNETTAALTGVSTSGGVGTNAGIYTHTASGSATNYNLSFTAGDLTIEKANLNVMANNDARLLTQADAVNFAGVSFSGFVNGETAAVLTGTAKVSRPNASSDVVASKYTGALQASGLSSSNYNINYTAGDYTIVPSN